MPNLDCSRGKVLIGCVHLKALPGAPLFDGDFDAVLSQAVEESRVLQECGFGALIFENLNDHPFFPFQVPPETIAAMAVAGREISRAVTIPIGVNVLRNDAHAALAIASAIGAEFVRVNVHMHAVVADQGIVEGRAYETMRLRKALGSRAQILADVGVKHAAPLAGRGIAEEARDLASRGLVDALIVSGAATGAPAALEDLDAASQAGLPVLVGSGITAENLGAYLARANGAIVGSSLKVGGEVRNTLDRKRAHQCVQAFAKIANSFP